MSKILVVDDEMQIRKLIRKYAEFDGHEVFEAENGMQAVTMVRKNEFDAVIMDIMMPELDGFSACREIRRTSNVRTRPSPCYLYQANAPSWDRHKH